MGDVATLVYNFCLSMIVRKIVFSGPSLRYTVKLVEVKQPWKNQNYYADNKSQNLSLEAFSVEGMKKKFSKTDNVSDSRTLHHRMCCPSKISCLLTTFSSAVKRPYYSPFFFFLFSLCCCCCCCCWGEGGGGLVKTNLCLNQMCSDVSGIMSSSIV